MGSRSLLEGPYKAHLADKPEQTADLARQIIKNPKAKILVSDVDGKLNGVFCFVVFPHYFSGEMTASEMIWYVEPEARKMSAFGEGPAVGLLKRAEMLAKELGAKYFQIAAPVASLWPFYERLGFSRLETAFQRPLCP